MSRRGAPHHGVVAGGGEAGKGRGDVGRPDVDAGREVGDGSGSGLLDGAAVAALGAQLQALQDPDQRVRGPGGRACAVLALGLQTGLEAVHQGAAGFRV